MFQRSATERRTIFDHHYLFWLGDLNYRIDLDGLYFTAPSPQNEFVQALYANIFHQYLNSDSTIKEYVRNQSIKHLLEHDQVRY